MLNIATPLRSVDVTNVGTLIDVDRFSQIARAQKIKSLETGVFSFQDVDLYRLQENFGEMSGQIESEVKIFCTKDKSLLDQYYALRHQAYREENKWEHYNGLEDEFDGKSIVVVAIGDGKVVGGMRLMFSDECGLLSNEISGTQYEYKKFISKYDNRENLIIGEMSLPVVRKTFRDFSATDLMMKTLFDEAVKHGCDYVFGVSIAAACRNDRRIAKRLGYDVEIAMNFPWEQKKVCNFAHMFPMYARLK